jgi:hypothetical protein
MPQALSSNQRSSVARTAAETGPPAFQTIHSEVYVVEGDRYVRTDA